MDTTTLVITLIGQIATWLTIVLVYFTLREMRNQRKATQKPDLILPKLTVYGYVHTYPGRTNLFIPRNWSDSHEAKQEGYDWQQAGIKLYNVGFGVAKNIELTWIIDYEKTLQQIKDYCYQHSIQIIIHLGEKEFTIWEANHAPDISYALSSQVNKYDFLMPASITSDGLASSVPTTFVELVSILIYLKYHYSKEHPFPANLEVEIPNAKLELHYDDMENSHYSKSFEVAFSIGGLTIYADEASLTGKQEVFRGSFEFKSI